MIPASSRGWLVGSICLTPILSLKRYWQGPTVIQRVGGRSLYLMLHCHHCSPIPKRTISDLCGLWALQSIQQPLSDHWWAAVNAYFNVSFIVRGKVTKTVALNYLFFSQMLLYVHRDHKDCWGRGAQDSHIDFHTAPELRNHNFTNVALHPQKP